MFKKILSIRQLCTRIKKKFEKTLSLRQQIHTFATRKENNKNILNYIAVNTLSYRTVSISKEAAIANREWFVIDLEGQIVGRVASRIASILRGKHKPTYTPHTDCGDYVIVLNADKVRFTGKKMTDKTYLRHTGYPGGQRSRTPIQFMQTFPERIIESAVRGMLPKNILGRAMFKKMLVYSGNEHPHKAQKPKTIEL